MSARNFIEVALLAIGVAGPATFQAATGGDAGFPWSLIVPGSAAAAVIGYASMSMKAMKEQRNSAVKALEGQREDFAGVLAGHLTVFTTSLAGQREDNRQALSDQREDFASILGEQRNAHVGTLKMICETLVQDHRRFDAGLTQLLLERGVKVAPAPSPAPAGAHG